MAASLNLCKSSLRSFLISPIYCRQILLGRIQSCSTKPKEQSEETKQEQERCFGINYLKEGTDPPLLSDNEYPDWLWKLTDVTQTTEESSEENITNWKKLNKKRRRQENEIKKQKKL